MSWNRRDFLKIGSFLGVGSLFGFGKEKKTREGVVLLSACTFCGDRIYNKRDLEPKALSIDERGNGGWDNDDVWYHVRSDVGDTRCIRSHINPDFVCLDDGKTSRARPMYVGFERVSFEEYLKLKKLIVPEIEK